MAYEAITRAPVADDFTLLSNHQEQTPNTFFGGKPVLHLHCPAAKLKISHADLASQPDFAALGENIESNGDETATVEISGIDIWVTSKHLSIFASTPSKGIQIPYPSISIHAQDRDAVLLELNLSDPHASDDELVFLQLRLVPALTQPTPAATETNGDHTNGSSDKAAAALYNAISDCQELNPDPPSDGEGEGFDETAPGATGWITSENMQDFMDEDGNLRLPEGIPVIGGEDEGAPQVLGEGAGRTRTAAEVDGDEGEDDESKWQRTA